MTLNKAQEVLDGFLEDAVSPIGFRREEALIYSCAANDATALLSFPLRLDLRGPACFGCNVWLHFGTLEELLRGSAAKRTLPTISMPLHLLRAGQRFTEWQFFSLAGLENLRNVMIEDLRVNALPFIEEYSRLPNLRPKLESNNPEDWFVLDPEQRLSLLAVIRFVQGDKVGALKSLEEALLERKTALPKKRLTIEAVRRRLAQRVEQHGLS